MSDTSRLGLPRIDAAQSQKHVTHNEALDVLDALVHLSVCARNVLAPPANVAEGWQGLVGAAPQGVFAGHALQVAIFRDGAWAFYPPRKGWRAYVEPDKALLIFDGADWARLRVDVSELQNLKLLGVGTNADAQNPFSLKLNAALFAAVPVSEGGTGDLRMALNRQQASNSVSQLYQSNWSGRVETGLMGDDKYRIKVSADGAVWKEALVIDPATGLVNFPNGFADLRAPDPRAQVVNKGNNILFAPFNVGDGGTGDVRIALNREQASNTVSQLYQSNWSGRVETGLMGDDKYRIKVSADGAAWKEALVVDPATGRVNFPNGFADLRTPDPRAQVVNKGNNILFAPFNVGDGGTGDVRIALNREQASNTVSQLYQSNWSGRVETGLMGDDKYRIKVSADGAAWKEALVVDPATARVSFPNGLSDPTIAPSVTGVNLLDDGGRFAGNPEPVTPAVTTFADATWLTSVNGATRANYGVARPGGTLVPISDLLNKIRPINAQAGASEFFVLQVTAGTGVVSPASVQGVNYYAPLSSARHVGRGVTAGLYFRVISGALVMAQTDSITRMLIDGVSHDLWTDAPARIFNATHGWKQMQMWQAPLSGAVSGFWPMRVTPGSVVLLAAPFVASGLQTFATDIGPLPSQRVWR